MIAVLALTFLFGSSGPAVECTYRLPQDQRMPGFINRGLSRVNPRFCRDRRPSKSPLPSKSVPGPTWMSRTLLVFIAVLVMVVVPTQGSEAATRMEIDASVSRTLQSFERQIGGARDLANKAAGILVFPSVVKAGIGFGGEYGEGLLIIRGRPGGYYNLLSGSFGLQLGVQVRSVIIMFMTQSALASFENTYGWKVGVDGSVAIVTLGAGGAIDTGSLTSPVLGFILDPAGLMYNLTLEGSKISRITR
jgi:lipid-binding SYLF domain-containing protein